MSKSLKIFFILFIKFTSCFAMENFDANNKLEDLPNEIFWDLIDCYIENEDTIKPNNFKNLALVNQRLYKLCFNYYKAFIEVSLQNIITKQIDPGLAEKMETADYFKYCYNLNQIFLRASRLINKSIINLANTIEDNAVSNGFYGLKKLLKRFEKRILGNLVINYDRICVHDLLILAANVSELKQLMAVFNINLSKKNIKKTLRWEHGFTSWYEHSLTNNQNVFNENYLSMITFHSLLPLLEQKEIINNIIDIYANKLLEEFRLDNYFYWHATEHLIVNLKQAIANDQQKSQNLFFKFLYPVFWYFKINNLNPKLYPDQIAKIQAIFQVFDKTKLDFLNGFID